MAKVKIISVLLGLCFPLTTEGQTARPAFSAKEIKEDLEYLRTSLEATHFNLYAYTPKEDFLQHYHALATGLTHDSLSYLQAVNLFQRVITKANMGHCEIDFPAQAYIQYATAGGTVFPLEIAFEEGNAFVRKNFPEETGIKPGALVRRINGQTIESILGAIYPHLSAEREYFKNAKLEFYSFPRLYWQVFGQQDTFEVELEINKAVVKYNLKAISIRDYETSRNGEILQTERSFKLMGSTAYLHPGAFSGEPERGETKFRMFVDSAFVVFRQNKSKKLILDLRNHPGGHNAYSDYVISYFATKPFKWHSSFRLKASQLLKKQIRLQPDTTDAYSKAILAQPDGKIFAYEHAAYPPMDEKKRFTGKVYVLVNRQTHSMAAVAAAQVQDYKFGRVVGEETGDMPTLYASQFSYALPQTGIIVKVPKGYMVRPNGSEKLEGVQPDIVIKDHLLDEEDEILKELLARINKGTKSKSSKS